MESAVQHIIQGFKYLARKNITFFRFQMWSLNLNMKILRHFFSNSKKYFTLFTLNIDKMHF